MASSNTLKGALPACSFDSAFMQQLWDILSEDKDFVWQAKVNTGGDLLGKQQERPEQIVATWEELVNIFKKLHRVDGVRIHINVPQKGEIAIAFRNYAPAGGILTIGGDTEWAEQKYERIMDLFARRKKKFVTLLYSKLGFGVVQTLIPLTVSFIVVMLLAGVLIPYRIRNSDMLWWITAGTLIITLRLAYTISDKMIIYILKNYPYIRWLS